MKIKIAKINTVGNLVYYNPTPTLNYKFIANNSLEGNTLRGFHRINKSKRGPKEIFVDVFVKNESLILNSIKSSMSEDEIDILEQKICDLLLLELKVDIKNDQLDSFNKIRKPVDIFIQHILSMGEGLEVARSNLIQHLFLPLDSQMFQSGFIFSDEDILSLKLSRCFSFKDIEENDHYYRIQQFLKDKSKKIGIEHRIFLDLIWNQRYNQKGTNVFLLNPKRKNNNV